MKKSNWIIILSIICVDIIVNRVSCFTLTKLPIQKLPNLRKSEGKPDIARTRHILAAKITPSTDNSTNTSTLGKLFGYIDSIVAYGSKITPKSYQTREIRSKIVIIGAGLAGLTCAMELLSNGIKDFIVVEASDDVGGRIRSDTVDGFILDRGFFVFIEAYPESLQTFNYPDLNLRAFRPGALIRYKDDFHLVSDPIRRPQDLIPSLASPIGSLLDKVKVCFEHKISILFNEYHSYQVGIISILIRLISVESIGLDEEFNTEEYLVKKWGLSSSIIDSFFKPFFQGIFLSPIKQQSSRLFTFVFKMFSEGSASLPSRGIGDICSQLAKTLPSGSLYLNTKFATY